MAGFEDLVSSAYTDIGKSSNDQAGQDYWVGQLDSGALTTDNFQTAFDNSVADYNAKSDSTVRDAYAGIGRYGIGDGSDNYNTIDPDGYNYWTNQLSSGALSADNFGQAFTNSVNDYNATQGTTIGSGSSLEMPSMSNELAPEWINALAAGIPNYFDAYDRVSELPGEIDAWVNNAVNKQRATGDQIALINNKVGNNMAGTGIMGGTAQSDMSAGLKADLAEILMDNTANIEWAGSQMKADAISGLPSTAMQPISAMTSLYGTNASDQQNWASLAANLLTAGY